jgi:hypothetical protein
MAIMGAATKMKIARTIHLKRNIDFIISVPDWMSGVDSLLPIN